MLVYQRVFMVMTGEWFPIVYPQLPRSKSHAPRTLLWQTPPACILRHRSICQSFCVPPKKEQQTTGITGNTWGTCDNVLFGLFWGDHRLLNKFPFSRIRTVNNQWLLFTNQAMKLMGCCNYGTGKKASQIINGWQTWLTSDYPMCKWCS